MRVGISASNDAVIMKSMLLFAIAKTYSEYLNTRNSGHYRRLNKMVLIAHDYYGIPTEIIGEVFVIGVLGAKQ